MLYIIIIIITTEQSIFSEIHESKNFSTAFAFDSYLQAVSVSNDHEQTCALITCARQGARANDTGVECVADKSFF